MGQTGTILSFLRARPSSDDWTQQELAEFYRVESALLQHGLLVSTDRGLSDEGDPWFVFCRSETEEVIAHFAKIDGYYLVVSSAFSGVAQGRDFKKLIRELMEAHPLMLPRKTGTEHNVFVHPAATLAALLAASYIVGSDKDADIQDVSAAHHEKTSAFWLNLRHDFAILSAVAIAATWMEHQVEGAFDFGKELTVGHEAGHNAGSSAADALHFSDLLLADAILPQLQDDGAATHGIQDHSGNAFAFGGASDPTPLMSKFAVQSTVGHDATTSITVDSRATAHADNGNPNYGASPYDSDLPIQASDSPVDLELHHHPVGSGTGLSATTLGDPTAHMATSGMPVTSNAGTELNPAPSVSVSTSSPTTSDLQVSQVSMLSTSSSSGSATSAPQDSTQAPEDSPAPQDSTEQAVIDSAPTQTSLGVSAPGAHTQSLAAAHVALATHTLDVVPVTHIDVVPVTHIVSLQATDVALHIEPVHVVGIMSQTHHM